MYFPFWVSCTGLFEMTVGVLTACHTQHTSDSSICVFSLTEQHCQFLLHTLQVLCMCTVCDSTGWFKMIVGVLTNCHTQYTSDSSICIIYLIEQHCQFLLHNLQVLCMCTVCDSTDINTIMMCKHKRRLLTAVRRHLSKLRFKRRNA